jgi:hypothetical protein
MIRQQQKIFIEDFGFSLYGTQEWPKDTASNMTIIAKILIEDDKIIRVGFLPCLINSRAQPEVLKHDERGQKVFDYMEKITMAIDLNATYQWEGDEVVILNPG